MINELIKIVGRENVSVSEIDKLAYSSDASQLEGKAVAVVWPETTEQIQKMIVHAVRSSLNIVPRGAGTGLAGAVVPNNSIVLDLSRMNKILESDVENRHVAVEPGIVLNHLNGFLQQQQLFFPVIPASYKVCTIGGMIATNAAGERAIKYGKTKDWVLGLEVVSGAGNIFNLKTKKEIGEFCGTEGCLGIITKAELKLSGPLKRSSASLLKFDRISDLMDAVKKYKTSKDVIAIEFFDKLSAKLSKLEEKYYLFVEFESDSGEIRDEGAINAVWNLREGLGPVLTSEGFSIMEDPLIPLENMDKFLQWLEKNKIPCFGHIGIGIVHPRFTYGQKHLIGEMFNLVGRLSGEASGEHGIGIAKKGFANKEFVNAVKKLKKKYDPNNILNREKII